VTLAKRAPSGTPRGVEWRKSAEKVAPRAGLEPATVEENKVRGYCLWQEWSLGVLALDGKLRDIPVSGLAWRKLRTWRR
jgi:hypothetical protein